MSAERAGNKIRFLGKEVDPNNLAVTGLVLMMISWPIGVKFPPVVGLVGMVSGFGMIMHACSEGRKLA